MVKWFSTMVQRWFNRERIVFSTNDAGTIEYPYVNLNLKKPRSVPHIIYKIISIIWLNVAPEITKLLKEDRGKNVHGLVWSKDF